MNPNKNLLCSAANGILEQALTVFRKAPTFAPANNSDKFLYTFLLLHLIPVASSCHDVPIFSDHLCANFGDDSQNNECHTEDIGRPLFIKEMDVGGDFR